MTLSPPLTSPVPPPVSQRRLNLISLVLVLGLITTILDTTIVNIALDHLHTAFNASVADTQWVVTAYLLAYVAVIPISGWASERFGARRVWMFAVTAFLVGSLLCGLAWNLPALIGFRVLQGIGGGMVLPVTITILTRAAGKARIGRAIATIGLIGQLGPILGPIIGGSIIDSIGWHWLFYVNLPVCLAALVLAPFFLPTGETDRTRSLDALGVVLLTPGIVAVAYGISQAVGVGGFAAVGAWLPLIIGAAFIAAFALHSLRAKRPALLDVRLFARRSFGLSSVITFAGGFSLYALMFLLPMFYQQIRGESVFTTGLLLIPQGLGTMCFILLNRRLAGRIDTRFVIAGGVIVTMIGILPFALAASTGGDVLLLAGQFLQGFGMGAVSLPVMTLAFAGLSHAETPRGSAAFSVVQRVGAPFGVTVIAVILQSYLTGATTAPEALGAFTATFWWVFALSPIPLLLALLLPAASKATTPVTASAAPAEPITPGAQIAPAEARSPAPVAQ
ncbi:DHA2 family efflux MFS transporter permease subunit [Leifsonia kafniensis]|uniref:DHA2 family efflux MFS transporter permease subunit n=1 Tax=Leifsonia kafniensis TaxID=475957 RepID=A0ABP7KVE9_9MICO